MSANTDEQAFWSGEAGAKWIVHEVEQDHFLSAVASAVVARAALTPGERVLDIGCGTGALSLLAAEAVGERGAVVASDIAAPFIARVNDRAAGLSQVRTLHGDAQTATRPDAPFDAAVSRFGVMFFGTPAVAFANIARALRPGGRFVFAAWAGADDNPYWSIPRDLIDRLLSPMPRPEPHAPGPMGLADADWAVAQLRAGGFEGVAVETREIPLLHDAGAAGAAGLALRIGPAARALADAEAGPEMVARFQSEIKAAFAPYESAGVARVLARIHLYTGHRA